MDIETIQVVHRVRTELGVTLPYRKVLHGDWDFSTQPASRPVISEETGEVFIPWSLIEELSENTSDSLGMGGSLIIGYHEGLALEQSGFAVQETRGGYHGTETAKVLERHITATYKSAEDPLTLLGREVHLHGSTLRREWPRLMRAIDKILYPGQ